MTPSPMNATLMLNVSCFRQPHLNADAGHFQASAISPIAGVGMAVSDRPIIIKKVKKVVGGGHHGGAWKVAYADFVTAMMAFFLLMWLINTTSPSRSAASPTISPPPASRSPTSGSGGILGGTALGDDGAKATARTR